MSAEMGVVELALVVPQFNVNGARQKTRVRYPAFTPDLDNGARSAILEARVAL